MKIVFHQKAGVKKGQLSDIKEQTAKGMLLDISFKKKIFFFRNGTKEVNKAGVYMLFC